MYAERLSDCNEEEANDFLEELRAPLNAKERRAEQNIGNWLRR